MRESVGRREGIPVNGKVAHELPSRHLPPATYEDLPEPLPLGKVVGPGVVSIGIGVASGELILWPYITAQVGLVFLWAAIVGILTQWFINMEIERYTLATGETAITGFSRMWKPWGLVFCLGAIAPNAWPGWVTSAATVTTFLFGLGEGAVVPIAIAALFIIGVVLSASPVIYQTVEKIEFFKVGAVIVFLLVAVVFVISGRAWAELPGATVQGFGRLPEGLSVALVLGALAFAGAGGVHNLVQSNWIRDKGYGMGARIPRLVSPITGEDQARPSTGYVFPETGENMRRWRGWWRVANIEQFVTFFLLGALTIVLMSMLAYSTVYGNAQVAERYQESQLAFLQAEGQVLGQTVGGWFQVLFYAIGAVSLFAGALGILDYVGRAIADVLKTGYLANSTTFTESRIYLIVIWAMILAGTVILLTLTSQPLLLLVISSASSGVVMFIYSILLIVMNRSMLPRQIRTRGVRLAAMIWAVLFFGGFSAVVIIDQIRANVLGG
jgi:hypothetical protein